MKKTTKKIVSLFLALALILTTIGAGIGAYFTGTDKKNDTYTIGQIEVELVGEDDLYKAEKLTPNYEYDFTRSVKNIGINDAYVFMAVTIPCDDVFLHNLEGNHIDDAALTQLFTYGANDVAGVNGEWVLVTEGQFGDYDIADMAGRLVNHSDEKGALRTNDTATYIYAYVGNGDTLARLAPDAETTALFNIMKFANVSDTEITHNIENTVGKIKTQVFAIQCDNVLETEYMTGNNADGSEQVNAVWAVVNNALVRTNDIVNDKISIPVTAFDKDGNDLNASATVIEGQEADKLLDALENQGLANKADVDLLIDVKSDDFDDLADTTFDVSDVAKDGDTVIILHYNEATSKWEYITTDTVEDGKVGGNFESYSPVAIIVIPKDEEEEETTENVLMEGPDFNDVIAANTTSINFINAVSDGVKTTDVSEAQDGSIVAWYEGTDMYVASTDGGVIYANPQSTYMFRDLMNPVSFDFSNFSTSKVEAVDRMFNESEGLTELDLSSWDVSNIIELSGMFSQCTNLVTLDLSGWSLGEDAWFDGTFSDCSNLETIYCENDWSEKVVSFDGDVFEGCVRLVGAVAYDAANVGIEMANPTTGYFTAKGGNEEVETVGLWGNLYLNDTNGNIIDSEEEFTLTSVDHPEYSITKTRMGPYCCFDMYEPFIGPLGKYAVTVCGETSYIEITEDMFSESLTNGGFDGYNGKPIYDFKTINIYREIGVEEEEPALYGGTLMKGTDFRNMFVSLSGSYPREINIPDTITFDNREVPTGVQLVDVSADKDGSVVGWYEGNDFYVTAVNGGVIYANENSAQMFQNLAIYDEDLDETHATTKIVFDNFNTSNVKNMSWMFNDCTKLTVADVSGFDTSNVTNMESMFSVTGLKEINVSNFDTANVTNMSGMFCANRSLTKLDVSSFNTSKVTSMTEMFSECSGLTELNLGNFDTSNVEYMSYMFQHCSALKELDLSSFNTENVQQMNYMFYNCTNLVSVDVSSFNTSSTKIMASMFASCSSLEELDLSNFSVNSATTCNGMFSGCSSLKTIYANDWTTNSKIKSSSGVFSNCTSLVGAVSFNSSNIGGSMANPATGYFTTK